MRSPHRRPHLAVSLGLCATWGGALAACSATRDVGSGALDPRFVAVHNALAAMGLAEVGPIHEGSLAEGQEARVPLDLPSGCTTVVVFGGAGVRDVDAALQDARGQAIAHDTTREPQAVLRACVDGADAYVLVVKAASGSGHWVVATWAGGVGGGASVAGAPVAPAPPEAAGTCESPLPLAAGTVNGSTRAGASVNTGSCDHSDAREVVYELDVPRRQRVILDVDAHFDSVLYLRKDDCTDENAEVDCNDDSPTGGRNKSRIERVLDPGKYFVFVDGYNQESGAYTLTVSTSDVVALSDACHRAPRLAPGAVVAATTDGTADDSEASCGGGATGQDAPWRFELASRQRLRLIEHSDEMAPVVHVRSACGDAESEMACGESRPGTSDAAITGVFGPGGYTAFADARERDSAGRYTLSLETAPAGGSGTAGDACGDAMALAGSGGTVPGDTFRAHDDLSGSCGGGGAADVVYRVDVLRRSRLQASLQAEEAPHVLVAWRRCGDRASELACGPTLDEVLAPGSYFVAVDGATHDALGRFSLEWTLQDLAAQSTACTSAPVLTEHRPATATTAGVGDRFATSCGVHGGAADAPDRVFRFALAARAKVKLELTAANFDAFLALRRSCGDAAGSTGAAQLACSAETDRARTTDLEATLEGGTYWVVVDGQSPNDQGTFTLTYSILAR